MRELEYWSIHKACLSLIKEIKSFKFKSRSPYKKIYKTRWIFGSKQVE